MRAIAQMCGTTFKNLDICQRTIPLRKLHLMTLTYFYKVNNLKCQYFWNSESWRNTWNDSEYPAFSQHFSFLKRKWSLSCPWRFISTCKAPAVELFLFLKMKVKNHQWSWRNKTHVHLSTLTRMPKFQTSLISHQNWPDKWGPRATADVRRPDFRRRPAEMRFLSDQPFCEQWSSSFGIEADVCEHRRF